MDELPEPWGSYQRLQNTLRQRDRVDDVAWGLEAGLNRSLTNREASENISRAVESESRKERYRAQLRGIYFVVEPVVASPENELIAIEHLDRIRSSVAALDWELLCDVADGISYSEIAGSRQTTAGALRIHVFRLRRVLRAA